MSQYPSPYSVPNAYTAPAGYGYDPFEPYLAPARKAALLMFVVGGLWMFCGVCAALVAGLAPLDQIAPQAGPDMERAASELGISAEQFMRAALGVSAAMSLIVGLVMIVLAIFVRRGGMGSVVTSIVLTCLIGLLVCVQELAAVMQVVRRPRPAEAIPLIFMTVIAVAVVLLLKWLIQAARASATIRTLRMQYQMQYWQYQQQQQMYQQGASAAAYGYPPAQSPAPPNPEPQNPPEQQ